MYQPLSDERMSGLKRGNQPRSTEESAYQFANGIVPRSPGSSNLWQETFREYAKYLYSYGTVVATRLDPNGPVYVTVERYSSSTGRHISNLETQLRAAGYVKVPDTIVCSPSGTMGGWQRNDKTPYTVWIRTADTFVPAESVWTSPNGKWSIVPVWNSDGFYTHTIKGKYGHVVAYVSADETYHVTSGTIPQYVLAAFESLA